MMFWHVSSFFKYSGGKWSTAAVPDSFMKSNDLAKCKLLIFNGCCLTHWDMTWCHGEPSNLSANDALLFAFTPTTHRKDQTVLQKPLEESWSFDRKWQCQEGSWRQLWSCIHRFQCCSCRLGFRKSEYFRKEDHKSIAVILYWMDAEIKGLTFWASNVSWWHHLVYI